jgi:hypothetical protein
MRALSVRQPWAWAIIAGHKKFENRKWQTPYRGSLFIHAGKEMRQSEFEDVLRYAGEDGFTPPEIAQLNRGGIIGRVDLVEIVADGDGDPWFSGPYGWRLKKPRSLPFRRWIGQQRLFDVPD